MKKRHILILFLILIIAAGGAFIIFAHGDGEIIGQNELGSVDRVDFTHSSNPKDLSVSDVGLSTHEFYMNSR